MANRFEKGIVYDAPLQWHQQQYYTPDFKMWAGALDKQQTDYDTANKALSALRPNALPKWQKEANAYSQEWRDKATSLTDTYINQGVAAGNRLRNKLLRDVQNEVLDPQSQYNAFNSQTKKFTEERERLKKFHEKDPVKDNLMQSLNSLDTQVEEWSKHYNKDTNSLIKGIADVTATPFVDVRKDMIEFADKVQVDGQEIEYDGRNGWIYKESREGVPDIRIKNLFEGFINDPKYAGQLAASTFAKSSQYANPEEYQKLFNDNVDQNLELLKDRSAEIQGMLASKDPEKVREAQQLLQMEGYKVKDDGLAGNKTKAAMKQLEEKIRRKAEQLENSRIKELDKAGLDKAMLGNIKDSYKDQFQDFFGTTTSKTMKANDYWLIDARSKAKLKEIDHEFALMQGYSAKGGSNTKVTPNSAVSYEDLGKLNQKALTNVTTTKAEVDNLAKDKNLIQAIGFTPDEDVLNKMLEAYANSQDALASGDVNVFKANLEKAGINGANIEDVTLWMNQNGDKVQKSLDNLYEAKDQVSLIEETNASIEREYRETIGKQNLDRFVEENAGVFEGVNTAEEMIQKAEEYKGEWKKANAEADRVVAEKEKEFGRPLTNLKKEGIKREYLQRKYWRIDKALKEYNEYAEQEKKGIKEAIADNKIKSAATFGLSNFKRTGASAEPLGVYAKDQIENFNLFKFEGYPNSTVINSKGETVDPADLVGIEATDYAMNQGLSGKDYFSIKDKDGNIYSVLSEVNDVEKANRRSFVEDQAALELNKGNTVALNSLLNELYSFGDEGKRDMRNLKNQKLDEFNSRRENVVIGANRNGSDITTPMNISNEAYISENIGGYEVGIYATGEDTNKKYVIKLDAAGKQPVNKLLKVDTENNLGALSVGDFQNRIKPVEFMYPSLEAAQEALNITKFKQEKNLNVDLKAISAKKDIPKIEAVGNASNIIDLNKQ